MSPERKKPKENKASEYDLLYLQVCSTLQDRLHGVAENRYGTKSASDSAGQRRFVESFSPFSQETIFSIWYLDSDATERMSYKFFEGRVTKEGLVDYESGGDLKTIYYMDASEMVLGETETDRQPLSVELDELRIVSQLVADPIKNIQLVSGLPRLPRE